MSGTSGITAVAWNGADTYDYPGASLVSHAGTGGRPAFILGHGCAGGADDTILAANASAAGAGAFGAAGQSAAGTAAANANDRFVFDAGTGRLFFDADGANVSAADIFIV